MVIILGVFAATAFAAEASEITLPDRAQTLAQTLAQTPSVGDDDMEQQTSVSKLSDVRPTDWAFQALQSLVERYGCIAGYPNGTFRGNRALSRYEFAVSLNTCLNRIEKLSASARTNPRTREDLMALQRLREEFSTELGTLGARVGAVETRTALLAANQFSTTTKLDAIANFVVTNAFSGRGDNTAVLQERARLTFNTSFTGRDLLVNRIAAGNGTIPKLAGGTSEVVQAHQWYGNFNNNFFIVTLSYLFPINQKLLALVAPVGGLHADYAPTVNPFFEDYDGGRTTLSTFGQRNAIYRLGGGSGGGFLYNVNNALTLSAGYYGGEAFRSSADGGLFKGTNSALAQLTWKPRNDLTVGFTYHHGYFTKGQFGFGDNSPAYGVLGTYAGTGVVNNTLAQFKTVTNSYGTEASWRINPHFAIGGWVGLTKVRAIDTGDGEVWNYAVTLAFPDLGKKGNLGGIIVGAQPYLASLKGVAPFRNDTPVHVEGFFRYQVTDNISITPGVIWLTAPNQNANNEGIVIGTLRTTFNF